MRHPHQQMEVIAHDAAERWWPPARQTAIGCPQGGMAVGRLFTSLGEHLHPQQILVGPDDFQEVILRIIIPKVVNPVQKPICHVKYPGLGVLKQEDSFHLFMEL